MKKESNVAASYSYDQFGNRTKVTYGNNTYQTYDYSSDPRYMLNTIRYAYKCDTSSPVAIQGGLDLTRDKSGNPLTWGDSTDSYNKVYSYDENSRLASANLPGAPAIPYSYD